MKNKLLIVISCVLLFAFFTIPVRGLGENIPNSHIMENTFFEIISKGVNSNAIDLRVIINGNLIIMDAECRGRSGTTKIVGTLYLYEETASGTHLITSWISTSNVSSQYLVKQHLISGGRKYIVVYQAIVTVGGVVESISVSKTIRS